MTKALVPKIFCIGQNKTGTTSLQKAFQDLGYVVGDQRQSELLMDDILVGDYQSLFDYCQSAQVFQDVPFSLSGTYKHLDKAFPNSKFILSVRDSAEQWYSSLLKFHARIYGNGNTPTKEDLLNATYIYQGWAWKVHQFQYRLPHDEPYNKELLSRIYKEYNRNVIQYFNNRSKDLLVINLARSEDYERFCKFLNADSVFQFFPWENKSET